LPVVDEEGKLLGVVDVRLYAEEVFDLAHAARSNEIFQLIGLSVEQARQGTAATGFRVRMPWLLCNVASGVTCAVVAAIFQDVLAVVVLLAMFIPLVLTLSESVSMQAMTIGLQFLHSPRVPWRAVRTRLKVEWKTAILLGLASGGLVGMASLLWGGGRVPPNGTLAPAAVLALAIASSMLLSAMVGLSMPVLLHACRLDPKVAAGPTSLMLADVLTTTVYLGLATWWLI
jgi:magnesium transporter